MGSDKGHASTLRSFQRRLARLLMCRAAARLGVVWFFVWGVVCLAARIAGFHHRLALGAGLAAVVPAALLAAFRARRAIPALPALRAAYDHLNRCGGVIMAGEAGDMAAWHDRLPAAAAPELRWKGGRVGASLAGSALFAATVVLLPDKLTHLPNRQSLEIGSVVAQLQAEVKALQNEKIVEDKKAEDLQKQLAQMKEDSSGADPGKTWEALDHIKESNSETAKQAAEEALTKTSAISAAETLAQAMDKAAGEGMSEANAGEAARDLAKMLASAKLEEGLLKATIPPELTASLNGLSKSEMQDLLKALELNKGSLGLTLTNLAGLKMIDASMLSKCHNAGQCHNTNALAEYLCSCTNHCNPLGECENLCAGQGLGRGGPGAPMTWGDESSEKDLSFQEHALPPATELSGAQLAGVSRAAPQLTDTAAASALGALEGVAAGGGSARTQAVLPEHREAVRRFFKRD